MTRTKQDWVDRFIFLNPNNNLSIEVRMKIGGALDACTNPTINRHEEKYSQIITTLDDFKSILADESVLKINSITLSNKQNIN
jgi:ABC-type antimicrobial peptide transport system ATPase subunit